jgi:RNA polymerase sigma-70 factor (ECF subfamily)
MKSLEMQAEDAGLHDGEAVAKGRSLFKDRLGDQEEVERLLGGLRDTEALVVRMYHIEGKSYQEIGHAVGLPENSIGPILSRARNKMRRAGVDSAAS